MAGISSRYFKTFYFFIIFLESNRDEKCNSQGFDGQN